MQSIPYLDPHHARHVTGMSLTGVLDGESVSPTVGAGEGPPLLAASSGHPKHCFELCLSSVWHSPVPASVWLFVCNSWNSTS